MQLALFDFDGTITNRDSFVSFVFYAASWPRLLWGCIALLPTMLLFGLGLMSNHRAKENTISFFFKGMEEVRFRELAHRFSRERLSAILRPKALERLIWHQNQGHHIYIVSASIGHWLELWCQELKLPLICTNLDVSEGRLTGLLSGANCWGAEKVRRIKELVNIERYKKIFAYGDSSGDQAMLALAHEPFYRPFV